MTPAASSFHNLSPQAVSTTHLRSDLSFWPTECRQVIPCIQIITPLWSRQNLYVDARTFFLEDWRRAYQRVLFEEYEFKDFEQNVSQLKRVLEGSHKSERKLC
jgi:hypothetical protein